MARTHAVTIEERRAARNAEDKYGKKVRSKHRRKQAHPQPLDPTKARKPPRWRWQTVAKREIRREIRNSAKKPAIPRAAIERVIRECAPGYQFEYAAMASLRTAAEAHVVAALEAARFVADAEQVPTLDARHMHVVAAITNKMTTPTPMPDEYMLGRSRSSGGSKAREIKREPDDGDASGGQDAEESTGDPLAV